MTKQQPQSPRGFASWGGVTAGVAAVLAGAAVATQIGAGEPTSDGIVALAAAMSDNREQAVVSSWLFMLTGVALAGFGAFILARWRQASAWVPLAAALFGAAAAVCFAENLTPGRCRSRQSRWLNGPVTGGRWSRRFGHGSSS